MAFVKKAPPPQAESQAEPTLPELLENLRSDNASTRLQAAHKLSAHAEVVAALAQTLPQEDSIAVRTAILTSLLKINTPEVAENLLPLLGLDNASLRNDVISALQQMQLVSLPHVKTLLSHDNPDMRIYGIYILAAIQHECVCESLLKIVQTEPHINVWGAALDALAECGTRDMIPAIESSLQRFDNDYGKFAVQFAVKRISG
jgi:HEAT repeat protein